MRVELIYFKPSGKYYTSDDYDATATEWNGIVDEVKALLAAARLPGLVEGARYDVLVMLSPPHLLRAWPMLTAPMLAEAFVNVDKGDGEEVCEAVVRHLGNVTVGGAS